MTVRLDQRAKKRPSDVDGVVFDSTSASRGSNRASAHDSLGGQIYVADLAILHKSAVTRNTNNTAVTHATNITPGSPNTT
jgi:hypothetical protein